MKSSSKGLKQKHLCSNKTKVVIGGKQGNCGAAHCDELNTTKPVEVLSVTMLHLGRAATELAVTPLRSCDNPPHKAIALYNLTKSHICFFRLEGWKKLRYIHKA